MIIKEAKYKVCKGCKSRKQVSETKYGCDWCKSSVEYNKQERSYLEITVFTNTGGNNHLHLCSWQCVHDILPTLESDYFINIPYLIYDEGGIRSAKEFFKIFYKKDK